jgi:TonB family protein
MLDRTPAVISENEDDLKCLAWAGGGPGRVAFQPGSMAMSVAAHVSLVALLFTLHVATKATKPRRTNAVLFYVTPLAPAPRIVRPRITAPRLPQPVPIRALATLPNPRLPSPPVIELPDSRPAAPPIQSHPLPKILSPAPVSGIKTDVFASAASAVRPSSPAPQIRTGEFDAPRSASLRQQVPSVQVVAAGFGDSTSAPAAAARRAASAGEGFGDAVASSGQAAGRSTGAVQTAGFGDSAGSPSGIGPRGSVRAGGFGDAVTAIGGPSAPKATAIAPVTAAQILEKPNPAYTDEARRLRIQGAVQLEIAFRASGQVEVLRIVRGLGHGLDENAIHAARGIRFLPAKRDGHAVDSTATVHIIFQLAS